MSQHMQYRALNLEADLSGKRFNLKAHIDLVTRVASDLGTVFHVVCMIKD
jgi:hypothetical protein